MYSSGLLNSAAAFNRGDNCLNILENILSKDDTVINRRNSGDDTPLHSLLKHGSLRPVELFLKHGADVNLRDHAGRSSISIATKHAKNSDVVKLLLDHGANANDVTRKNRTPLHRACIRVRSDMVKTLLEHGADVNAADNHGCTPLSYIIFNGMIRGLGGSHCPKSLRLLLLYNASDDHIVHPLNDSIISNSEHSERFILNPPCVSFHSDSWKLIVQCSARLSELNVQSPRLLEMFEGRRWLKNYHDDCSSELNEAKNVKLYREITFYDILTVGVSSLVDFVGNEELIEAFESSDYEKLFPIYSRTMTDRLELAQMRRANLDTTAVFLSRCIPKTDPSNIIIRKILSYLRHQDIVRLHECYVRTLHR